MFTSFALLAACSSLNTPAAGMDGCLPGSFVGTAPGFARYVHGTGNDNLNKSIREDVAAACRLYGVEAPMTIALESDSPNALAAPVADPNVYWPAGERRDGTVYFGLHLMQLVFKQSGGWGIPAIIGHEYGHILRYKRGFPNIDLKWRELHADFMSGFFTEHRARYKKQNVQASALQLFDGGDWAFNSPSHHGTPNERYAAFAAGVQCNLKLNKPDAGKAYDQGLEYLRSQGAPL